MWIWLTAALASGPAPRVVVDWVGDHAEVEVWAPLGVEFAPDAPVALDLAWSDASVHWESTGAALSEPITVGDLRGQALTGHLQLSMCDKADGSCVVRDFALEGWTTDKRKGQAVLQVAEAEPVDAGHGDSEVHVPDYQTDAEAIAGAAFAAAKADGKRVILDFGAVWCPPCNMLSAEVFHAPEPPPILDEYHLAVLDVDDPRSFALKSRYEVGGYPTIVIVEPDGTEVSREVGYPGREEMVDWLVRAAEQEGADSDLASVDPATVSPEEAASIAWLLAQKGDEAAAASFVERAAEAEEVAELHLARVLVEPNLDDARWLAENAPGTALEWVYPVKSLAESEEGRAILRKALQADLAGASGPDAADLMYLLAETAAEADQPLFYATAAAALRSALTGDPVKDKGHLTWLAVLTERSGDVRGALDQLEEAAARWPEEPTFYLDLASTHLRNDDPEASLEAAEQAMSRSWGDNKLRAGLAACKALQAQGREGDAKGVVDTLLAEIPPPEDALKVRTHTYRKRLRACADGDED